MNQATIKIDSGEIHIWTDVFSADAEAAGRMEAVLSAEEIRRAEAFRFRDDRMRYVRFHNLLRQILSRYSGIDPRDIRFEHGAHGKPYLAGHAQIRFNLSHTREMAAIAVTREEDVGIDIEKENEMKDMDDVAGQFMSADEFRYMGRLAPNLKKDFFYECWVRKEALMKAAGIGLGDHISRISVGLHLSGKAERNISANLEGKSGPWRLETFRPASDHIGAVCIEALPANKDYAIRFQKINASERFE